jgi:hypothetical protein
MGAQLRKIRPLWINGADLVGVEEQVRGCAPDLFMYAAVLDVPFRVEETCPPLAL